MGPPETRGQFYVGFIPIIMAGKTLDTDVISTVNAMVVNKLYMRHENGMGAPGPPGQMVRNWVVSTSL